MKRYLGHIFLGLTILFVVVCIGSALWGTTILDRTSVGLLVALSLAFGSGIAALMCGALAYVTWTPRWARNEARGRSLYDARKSSVLMESPTEQREAQSVAYSASEKGIESDDD